MFDSAHLLTFLFRITSERLVAPIFRDRTAMLDLLKSVPNVRLNFLPCENLVYIISPLAQVTKLLLPSLLVEFACSLSSLLQSKLAFNFATSIVEAISNPDLISEMLLIVESMSMPNADNR
jgi:hypothetical protein